MDKVFKQEIQNRRMEQRTLGDLTLTAQTLFGGRGELLLTPAGDSTTTLDHWEFSSWTLARLAMVRWKEGQKEPSFWSGHPPTQRYRIGGQEALQFYRIKRDFALFPQMQRALQTEHPVEGETRQLVDIEDLDASHWNGLLPDQTHVLRLVEEQTQCPRTPVCTSPCRWDTLAFIHEERCVLLKGETLHLLNTALDLHVPHLLTLPLILILPVYQI